MEQPFGEDLPPGTPLEPPERIGPMRSRSLALGSPLPSLFGLAPCGVYPASAITAGAVRSYRTFSPLPDWPSRQMPFGPACPSQSTSIRRYVLCGTSRPRAFTPASRTLSGTLPCGVRTFLPRQPSYPGSGSDRPVLLPVDSVSRILLFVLSFWITKILHSFRISTYGTSRIGVLQKAVFCAEGSITVIWQSYWPRGSLSTPRSKLSGMMPSRLAGFGTMD
jgi:hypothetical protein